MRLCRLRPLGCRVVLGTKICPFDGRRCFRGSCDFLDRRGSVRVCKRHRGRGIVRPRLIKPDLFRNVRGVF